MRVFFVLAILVGFLIYSTGLWAPFHLDDSVVISSSQNLDLHLDRIRALGYFTFWLNQRAMLLAGAVLPWSSPFYFRFVNVFIHVLSATALFWFVRELTGRWQLAAVAGALLLVHPIETQAVTYISQRFESQAALFMFLSGAAYVRFRRLQSKAWAVASGIFGVAAALTKETAVVLPVWLALIEIAFFEGAVWLRKYTVYLLGLFALLLIPGVRAFQGDTKNLFGWVPWYQYFFTQGPILTKYFQLAIWPRRQFLFYDVPLVTAFTWTLAAEWLLVFVVIGFGIYLLRRNTLAGFGILSFFVFLLPVLLLPLPDLMYEHRLYGAFAGVAIAACGCIQAVDRKWVFAVVGVLVVLFGIKTAKRNSDWNDQLHFMELHHAAFPQDPQILSRLASYYYTSGYVNKSLELNLEARRYEYRFNNYYKQQGQLLIAINLATAYLAKDNRQAAEVEARRAIAAKPNEPLAWRVLAYVQLQSGEFKSAVESFRKYAELSSDAEAWEGLQLAATRAGDPQAVDLATSKLKALEANATAAQTEVAGVSPEYKRRAIFAMTLIILGFAVFVVWTLWSAALAFTSAK